MYFPSFPHQVLTALIIYFAIFTSVVNASSKAEADFKRLFSDPDFYPSLSKPEKLEVLKSAGKHNFPQFLPKYMPIFASTALRCMEKRFSISNFREATQLCFNEGSAAVGAARRDEVRSATPSPKPRYATIGIDHLYKRVGNWNIGYNYDRKYCLAAAVYSGGSTLFVGANASKQFVIFGIFNKKWKIFVTATSMNSSIALAEDVGRGLPSVL